MTDKPPKVEDEPGAQERFDQAIKNALATPPKPRKPTRRTEAEVERLLANAIRDRDAFKGKRSEHHQMAAMAVTGFERELRALREGADISADDASPGSA